MNHTLYLHELSLPVICALLLTAATTANGQDVRPVGNFENTGVIRSIRAGQITVRHDDGERVTYKIQDKDEDAISLDGDQLIFNIPCEIKVSGTLPATLLERGMIVKTEVNVNRFGRTQGESTHFEVIPAEEDAQLTLVPERQPQGSSFEKCELTCRIIRVVRNRALVEVHDTEIAKQERLEFKIAEDATMDMEVDSLNRVKAGDTVNLMRGIELNIGALVVQEIDITMTAPRQAATLSYHDQLEQRFSDLSDEPREPRERRSDHFVVYTDISERQAAILLAKLETMYELVGRYYGSRPRDVIECYVVRDLSQWGGASIPPAGVDKIMEGAGVTRSLSNGRQTKSIVYSCDDQDVVQHEAVHAFCAMAFGTTGPVWYAEGMAEMGQYWRPGELAVDIDPVVIEYLTSAEPKKLADIVAAGQITGDSWQAYAWRWALCHLLASNPNYQRRFKRLGINMMREENDSFQNAFGPIASEISFEYDQFIENFGNGYRVDLCVWDWETEASSISLSGRSRKEVKAAAGWQATSLEVREGEPYDFVAQGAWKIVEDGEDVTANGTDGEGRLVGVILHEYQLTEPFELGEGGTFVAPVTGQLYLRCEDSWTDLADNDGEITVFIRRTPMERRRQMNLGGSGDQESGDG
ncbi:MAG: hypothetical protein AAF456_21470 [Planctomycetota bacterium]